MRNKKPILIVLVILSIVMIFSGCSAIQNALVGTPLEGIFGNPPPAIRIITDGEINLDNVQEKVSVEITASGKTTTLKLSNTGLTVTGLDALVIGENEISVTYGGETTTATITIVPKTFDINYIAGSNGKIVGSSSQKVKDGGTSTEVTAVANEGYQFDKWSDGKVENARTDVATKSLTVYAQFISLKIKVTFLDYEGNELLSKDINFNSQWKKENDPNTDFLPESKEFMYFEDQDGKKLDYSSSIRQNTVYKMIVKNKTVEITYKNEDGSNYRDVVILPYGNALVHNDYVTDPEKIGHTFAMWTFAESADEGTDLTSVKKNLIFVPTFVAKTYTVRFENEDGTEFFPDAIVAFGDSVTEPDTIPTKPNNDFFGWRDQTEPSSKIDFTIFRVTGDVTFSPLWSSNPPEVCTLSLYNRITGTTVKIYRDKGKSVGDLTEHITPIEGMKVDGIIEQSTKLKVYPNQTVEKDMKLEIEYVDIMFRVTFNTTIDGQIIEPRYVKYKTALKMPSIGYGAAGTADFILPEGKDLNGWLLNGVLFDRNTLLTSDLELTADITTRRFHITLSNPAVGAKVYINGKLFDENTYVEYGSNIVFKIVLEEGTTFTTTKPSIKINNGVSRELKVDANDENAYSANIDRVNTDIKIEFAIKQQTYDVDYSNTAMAKNGVLNLRLDQSVGIVNGSHNATTKTLKVSHNGKLVFSIVPFDGYRTLKAYYGAKTDADVIIIGANNTITLSAIKKGGMLYVDFDKILYNVNWRVDSSSVGSIDYPPRPTLVEGRNNDFGTIDTIIHDGFKEFTTTYGSSMTFMEVNDFNYEIWLDNGRSVVRVYVSLNYAKYRVDTDGILIKIPSTDKNICAITEDVTIIFKLTGRPS